MKLISSMVPIILLAGCKQEQPPRAKLSDEQIERIRKVDPNMTEACLKIVKYGGIQAISSYEDCERMTQQQRWAGLWRNDFEGSRFCPVPAGECLNTLNGMYVSLEWKRDPPGYKDTPPGGLYAVDFVGRRTLEPDTIKGAPSETMIVDRLKSIKLIEPPPPGQMTKEHIEGYLKDCAGKEICMPNSEVPKSK